MSSSIESLKEQNALLLDILQPHFEKGTSVGICYVPTGWTKLVSELHNRLVKVSPDYILVQVKEKFGGLRFYVEMDFNVPDELSDDEAQAIMDARADTIDALEVIIREYELRSYATCQFCGASSAHPRGSYWITTLCESCYVENKETIK